MQAVQPLQPQTFRPAHAPHLGSDEGDGADQRRQDVAIQVQAIALAAQLGADVAVDEGVVLAVAWQEGG
jgi:hypothetical protein